jgi:hypothetical protein
MKSVAMQRVQVALVEVDASHAEPSGWLHTPSAVTSPSVLQFPLVHSASTRHASPIARRAPQVFPSR